MVIQAHGTGGQSFGAFLAHGITLILAGEANEGSIEKTDKIVR